MISIHNFGQMNITSIVCIYRTLHSQRSIFSSLFSQDRITLLEVPLAYFQVLLFQIIYVPMTPNVPMSKYNIMSLIKKQTNKAICIIIV